MRRANVTDAVSRLGTEGAFAVLARARALEADGHDVIHLEIGEPDFETPPHVAEAGVDAIRAGETHYCQTAGLPALREAAAASLSSSRNVALDPQNVLVANGAKPFLFFTVLATCGAGDEVIYPDPGFPIYESAVRFVGATPVPLPLREERGFSFDPAELESLLSERTRLVILNAPHNPTGGVIPGADLERAAAAILRTPAWVLTDEVYSRITYDVVAPSIASLPDLLDRTILLDGFSKTFSMTGWRLGYAAVPTDLVDPLTRLIVNSISCVPPFVQLAGVAALEGPQDAVVEMVAEFRRRRDYLVPALNSIPGISCIEPGGAFYAFPNVSQLPLDADTVAERLLVEAGVALLAGRAFGIHATDHLRVSYASSLSNLEQAVERIRAFVASLDT
ncbi:pyridoxal phosphate-dependent aminotransferase [Gaiella sp.]|uniref:pyridoxal phosphate-dependent aminotransferase n=1 Tax=Gaiella sp. TaxID=2663207 RepID=UPI003982E44F